MLQRFNTLRSWTSFGCSSIAQCGPQSTATVKAHFRNVISLSNLSPSRRHKIEALCTSALIALHFADVRRAEDNAFVDAEASLRGIPTTMVSTSTSVMIQVWRVRNRLLMSSKTWYPCSERIRGLQTSFERAHESGTPQAVEALLDLTEIHAFAGNDAQAVHLGRIAVGIAEQQTSDWVHARTLVTVSHRLLRTRRWKYGLSLYSKARGLGIEEAVFSADLNSLAAE
jgi:hypothetical protein